MLNATQAFLGIGGTSARWSSGKKSDAEILAQQEGLVLVPLDQLRESDLLSVMAESLESQDPGIDGGLIWVAKTKAPLPTILGWAEVPSTLDWPVALGKGVTRIAVGNTTTVLTRRSPGVVIDDGKTVMTCTSSFYQNAVESGRKRYFEFIHQVLGLASKSGIRVELEWLERYLWGSPNFERPSKEKPLGMSWTDRLTTTSSGS